MTPYEEYAILDAKIKAMTNQKDEIKSQIIQEMVERGEDNASTAVGKFTIAKLKSWTYTEKVAELKEVYEEQKAKEESTGDATFEEKPSLRFTQIKL